jgi:hypothetical protein
MILQVFIAMIAGWINRHQRQVIYQDLDHQLIAPEPGIGGQIGEVRRRERLGGLLSYSYREAPSCYPSIFK